MRKFLNTLFLIALLVVVLLITLPLPMGLWLQKHYQNALNQLSSSSNISIKVLQFQRGWFRSLVVSEVSVKDPRLFIQKNKPLQFKIIQVIKHGPVVIGKLNKTKKIWLARAFVELKSMDPQIVLNGDILLHLGGKIENVFTVERVAIKQPGYEISAEKLNLRQFNAPQQQKLNGDAEISSLTFHKAGEPDSIGATIKDGLIRWNIYYVSPLWYGDTALVFKQLELTLDNDPNKKLVFDHFNVFLARSLSGQNTSASWRINIGNFKSPVITLDGFTANVIATNMNTKAFAAFFKAFQHLSKGPKLKENWSAILPHALNLLNQGLDIHIDPLTFGNVPNLVLIRADIHIPPNLEQQHVNYPVFLHDITATLRANENWLQKQLEAFYTKKIAQNPGLTTQNPHVLAQQQIQFWLNEKMLEKQGLDVYAQITYQKGELFLNGKKTFLNPLLNLAPQQQMQNNDASQANTPTSPPPPTPESSSSE